jgi:hypothetical protein
VQNISGKYTLGHPKIAVQPTLIATTNAQGLATSINGATQDFFDATAGPVAR